MTAALRHSSVVLLLLVMVSVLRLGSASASADVPCKRWPLLANYNITSKEFTCTGAITAFRLCSLHAFIHVGIIVWRKGKGVQGRRVEYANSGFDILHRELPYSRGDQLDYIVSYYYAPNDNEGIGCHIPLAFTTNYGYNCSDRMPKLYLKVTEECFQDVKETTTRNGSGTGPDGDSTRTPATRTSTPSTSTSTPSTRTSTPSANTSAPSANTITPSMSTHTPSTAATGTTTTSSGSRNTAANSPGTATTSTATTAVPTSPGFSTESNTRPQPATKAEENSTISSTEATTAAENNPESKAQNSSCPSALANGLSTWFRLNFGSNRSIVFIAMLTAIVFLLVLLVVETVVSILMCIHCQRRGQRKREEESNRSKPFKIGYRKAEDHDMALLGMDEPTEST